MIISFDRFTQLLDTILKCRKRSTVKGVFIEELSMRAQNWTLWKCPGTGELRGAVCPPGGTVRQPVEVQAQAWLDSPIPAPQPRARHQEHLVEQTTKCFQKTASASMALLLKRWCEPNSCSPNEIAVLASDAQHLQAQVLISEKPPKTSEHSPGVHTDRPLARQTSASEFPGNADERLQGPGPRSGCSSRNSGASFHFSAPHRSAFTAVWFSIVPLTLPQVDLRTNIQKGLSVLHETNADGITQHAALLKGKSPQCSVLTLRDKVSLSHELAHFPLLGSRW